ncbi:GNAT family N-acetyltransferase [Micromonospora olivasterospora]|uniref:GNAT family N-acetyltransferase n=1 Tax=Micromonospora olivasterospora TaxID=1880 RepID=UPI0031E0EC69
MCGTPGSWSRWPGCTCSPPPGGWPPWVTSPPIRARGRGLAAASVSALCARLRARVDHVTLNVRADNTAAVRLYERLGFTRVADFTECGLRRRA